MSQTELEISFDFVGTGKMAKGSILRYQSPLTVQKIIDACPLTVRGRYNVGAKKEYLMLLINIKKGMEKDPYKDTTVGDIVYCPQQDALLLVFAPTKLTLPVRFIGKISEGLDFLSQIPLGTNVKIALKSLEK